MKDITISSAKANLYAVPIAFLSVAISLIPFLLIWQPANIKVFFTSPFLRMPIYIPFLIIGIFLHEIIHAAVFIIIARVFLTDIKFGFQKKTFTPYVHCRIPVRTNLYRISLIAPALILGIIPAFIAIIFGQSWLLIYSLIFLIGAGGDLLILWLLRKTDKDSLVQDHPTRCGCTVFNK